MTGATRGIGTPLTARFVDNADTVIATDLSAEALKRPTERTDHHSALLPSRRPLRRAGRRATGRIRPRRPGHVDVTVNAAGHFPLQPYEEITPESWRRVLDSNLTGPHLIVQARNTFPEPLLKAQRQARTIRRDQQPDDLVGPVFFLASPDADFITGQTVNIDGGKFMP
ncbi:SDR family oxidoreductase [Nonomuraea angiospora]|uniref:SDR family oxidoreductase n=1 Tax=Nonomuraea angiospora TaxID=46172 RepID=UPI003437B049